MKDDRQFFLTLVIGLIIVYLVKNLYLLWINYVQYTFIYNNQLRLSGRLIDCYLKKPYTYHLDKNSAEIAKERAAANKEANDAENNSEENNNENKDSDNN